MSLQHRLALWDHLTRRLKLSAHLKLVLLTIANYTEPNGSPSRVPLTLLSRDCSLEPGELSLLLLSLEGRNLVDKVLVQSHGSPTVALYSLSSHLLRAAISTKQP
ncbi:hypothetical protein [Leptolyngbya sp. FACHB-261]|uniref:hypothetical protein n=1 Tax=Leptolyngbya sp. FACHB-261 TaxID=2692806 RepID=UPI0016897144|nr:hypothetical protein [Leptolyngbya sp. FACHB-261]MBD2103872.1 hypothetical protein [Leptolyngbya sp. FACHB-261]